MDLIIRICSILVIFFILIFFKKELLSKDNEFNNYGNYLAWNFARESGDTKNLGNFFSKIELHNVEFDILEEIFFESVVLNDWNLAEEISSKILEKDEYNFSANLFDFTINFLSKRQNNLTENLKKIDISQFDLNFIKVLLLWASDFEKKQDNLIKKDKECIPLKCLHYALYNLFRNNKEDGLFYLNKIKEDEFNSFRVSEILLYNFINNKNFLVAEKILKDLNNQNLNFGDFNVSYYSNNVDLLNPVVSKQDGIAEVFYNISSWYYTKNLYKYSAFFGELSLRFRPNFYAMKLLLIGTYEKLNYFDLALDRMENLKNNNIYFFKFLKLKLSILDQLEMNENSINELSALINFYPKSVKIKLLLADRLRSEKKFNDAIKFYTDILNNEKVKQKWGIFYSRGIAYEQSGQWSKAEKDLLDALELNPNDPYILNYLGYSWLDRKTNLKRALRLLETAVEIEPNDAYIVDSLGWAYFLSGFFDKSIFYLEKAVALLPSDATLNDHLGDAYWKSGRTEEAISQWKRVLIYDPNFKKKDLIKKKIIEGL